MKYPNLRYGNPNELLHYAQGIPIKELAKRLRRSERCVKNWLNGRYKIPYWVPELLRLQNAEHAEMMRQMGMQPLRKKLGQVTEKGIVYDIETRRKKEPNKELFSAHNSPPEALSKAANVE